MGGPEDFPTEKAMAPHSSTLAWKIPWTEEPGGLQSVGSLESDTTERLHFHFSLSCIGEGNGNPLQCSCLENPGDGKAWWAAVCVVAQSWTWLKLLSSSSSCYLSLILAILVYVKWYLTCDICFSFTWWLKILSIFSYVYWLFSHLLWNSSLGPLPIFKLGFILLLNYNSSLYVLGTSTSSEI